MKGRKLSEIGVTVVAVVYSAMLVAAAAAFLVFVIVALYQNAPGASWGVDAAVLVVWPSFFYLGAKALQRWRRCERLTSAGEARRWKAEYFLLCAQLALLLITLGVFVVARVVDAIALS